MKIRTSNKFSLCIKSVVFSIHETIIRTVLWDTERLLSLVNYHKWAPLSNGLYTAGRDVSIPKSVNGLARDGFSSHNTFL
jgi:hypothetical protein